MKLITADMLVDRISDKPACEKQLEIFKKQWPKGARVTKKNTDTAVRLGLDLDWIAVNLLSPEALRIYSKARIQAGHNCSKTTDPAWKTYYETTSLLRKDSRKTIDYQEILKINISAKEILDKTVIPASKTFYQAVSQAFYEAWEFDERAIITDLEDQPPQYDFNSDVVVEDCDVLECGWNRDKKCWAGTIHIDNNGYPDKCGETEK